MDRTRFGRKLSSHASKAQNATLRYGRDRRLFQAPFFMSIFDLIPYIGIAIYLALSWGVLGRHFREC